MSKVTRVHGMLACLPDQHVLGDQGSLYPPVLTQSAALLDGLVFCAAGLPPGR